MEGKASDIPVQVDEDDFSVSVPADGIFLEGDALLRQVRHGQLHIWSLQSDVAMFAAGAVLHHFEHVGNEDVRVILVSRFQVEQAA